MKPVLNCLEPQKVSERAQQELNLWDLEELWGNKKAYGIWKKIQILTLSTEIAYIELLIKTHTFKYQTNFGKKLHHDEMNDLLSFLYW